MQSDYEVLLKHFQLFDISLDNIMIFASSI